MLEALVNIITEIILKISYTGIIILMALESMIAPIPSELVMPFIGFLVATNKLSLTLAIIFSSLGTLLGSLISYYIGKIYGDKFVRKFGKYILLEEAHLLWTEDFFKKHGEKTIFIGRFIPVVRHVISIPAGIGKMNLPKFIIYTLIGGTIWNSFLLFLGYKLAENWKTVHKYSSIIDVIVIILFVIIIAWYFFNIIKIFKKNKEE
ncbi:DedA family protein [Candidatus Woesearchaeota archaeon]|nr:hypothetical protein [uncultured archaeon]AQS32313.1 hypothetical protein [uncultured archaeon]MBS3149428.1 DedA family protein [Candidatus Woesearchaeota archaeon]